MQALLNLAELDALRQPQLQHAKLGLLA